eukprot:5648098-Prymnesium_polylepis.1
MFDFSLGHALCSGWDNDAGRGHSWQCRKHRRASGRVALRVGLRYQMDLSEDSGEERAKISDSVELPVLCLLCVSESTVPVSRCFHGKSSQVPPSS